MIGRDDPPQPCAFAGAPRAGGRRRGALRDRQGRDAAHVEREPGAGHDDAVDGERRGRGAEPHADVGPAPVHRPRGRHRVGHRGEDGRAGRAAARAQPAARPPDHLARRTVAAPVTARAVGLLVALLALAAPARAHAAPPQISASSAIVVETSTGDVAYARRPDTPRSIASVTKLMTALLTLERSKLSDPVRAARYRALAVESKIDLRPGERLTTADMLRGLLLASANDAAASLAEVGGT